jgi:hypothetical protein
MIEVKLTGRYVRDLEWWIAYPCDPRFSYHDAGEILYVSEEEAADLVGNGLAVLNATAPHPKARR